MAGDQQQRLALVSRVHIFEMGDDGEAAEVQQDDATTLRYVLHLVHNVRQEITGTVSSVCARLAHEVAAISRDHARLVFSPRYGGSEQHPPMDEAFASFPVRFRKQSYGAVYIFPDKEHPELPSIPLAVAHLLAEACGLLLHQLEQSALLGAQLQHLGARQAPEQLNTREYEILALICRGYGEVDIARKLIVAPATVGKHRHHIYAKLGVHNEHEARLVAYREGLVSFLE